MLNGDRRTRIYAACRMPSPSRLSRCLRGPAAIAAAACVVLGSAAAAAPHSGLKHACSYKLGGGNYQDISYAGATFCAEARGLIGDFTDDGRRAPVVGVAVGHAPHGTWRCVTKRRVEVHGVIESSHRITCRPQDDPGGRKPRIRFFFES